jgi:uncharacterized protein (DUF488 family)
MAPLFTIGYEQTPAAAVLDELVRARVNLLVDVRAVASSRRPGFSKRQLAAGLDQRGIKYLHLRGLGTSKEGRLAARRGDLKKLFDVYQEHLKTPEAREELDALTALARFRTRLCLLCYERDHTHCHRQWIAERVRQRTGRTVKHLNEGRSDDRAIRRERPLPRRHAPGAPRRRRQAR